MLDKLTAREYAERVAREAGMFLHKNQHSAKAVRMKGALDCCTNNDLISQDLIVRRLREAYPSHSISSEEEFEQNGDSGYRWCVDPLDGTKNYVRDIDLCSVSIALFEGTEAVAGAVYRFSSGEMFSAHKGGGAWIKSSDQVRKEIATNRDIDVVSEAYVALDISKLSNDEEGIHNRICKNVGRTRNWGVGSLMLCYLAKGSFDLYVDIGSRAKETDIAAGLLIASEAGATIDCSGYSRIVAANKELLKDYIRLVQN